MPKIPFPHIIERGKNGNDRALRVVTDQDLSEGGLLVAKHHNDYSPTTGTTTGIYDVYKVNVITIKRKAKGDWSEWPKHPFYYECVVTYVSRLREDEIKETQLPSEV